MFAAVPMIPGPVALSPNVLAALGRDYGSAQGNPRYASLYDSVGRNLARMGGTGNDVVIMSGEGMLALWGGLKSFLEPKDRVLSIVTGYFGEGIGDMAASFGCEVRKYSLFYNETLGDLGELEKMIKDFNPQMITAVHCETPSGTLNPLKELGELKNRLGVPLLYVDAVSSFAGVPINIDDWHIDIMLGGTQKCLSAPPSLCFMLISENAWHRAAEVNYQGYDALLPWRVISEDSRFPYTPYYQGLAGLNAAIQEILEEGLENVFARHEDVAARCRAGLRDMGISLWNSPSSQASPTVTAAMIPAGFEWPAFQVALRKKGLAVAGSFGPMAGKVFRLGHMGTQAKMSLMEQTLGIIAAVL